MVSGVWQDGKGNQGGFFGKYLDGNAGVSKIYPEDKMGL